MFGKRIGAFGAGFLPAAGFAVCAGLLESLLFPALTALKFGDLLYGANVHLLVAFCGVLFVRLVFWKAPGRTFRWLAVSLVIFIELAVVAAYQSGLILAPLLGATLGRKSLMIVLFVAGAICATLLAGAIRRFFADSSEMKKPALIGLVLAGLLLSANLILATRAVLSEKTLSSDTHPSENQSLIVLLFDTLRRDHVSFFGYEHPTTPRLDRLLQTSYVFPQAYTPSNWTVPSVAALFTGLYPSSHGVYGENLALPLAARTLAEELLDRGYSTAAFVDNPAISAANHFDQGFTDFYPRWHPRWAGGGRTFIERFVRGHVEHRSHASWTLSHGAEINTEFFRWLDRNPKRPFFAYVHYMEPHHPYRPPEELREQVAPQAPPGPRRAPLLLHYLNDQNCRDWQCVTDPPRFSPDSLVGMIANYDGDIRWVDQFAGELIDGLLSRHLLDQCHLLVFSDHGEEFFDHQGWCHTYSIYEEVAGCVMGYRPPGGLPAARIISRPIAALDMVRSAFDMIGQDPPPDHQGRRIPELFGQSAAIQAWPVLTELPPHLFALRLGNWKIIRRGQLDQPTWMLFDMAADPGEQSDLSQVLPDTLQALRGCLDAVKASFAQTSLERNLVVDPEALARLRALGYVQ